MTQNRIDRKKRRKILKVSSFAITALIIFFITKEEPFTPSAAGQHKAEAHTLKALAEDRTKSYYPSKSSSKSPVEGESRSLDKEEINQQKEYLVKNEEIEQSEQLKEKQLAEEKQNKFTLSDTTLRFSGNINGVKGLYSLYVYSENEITRTVENPWAGAQTGDIIHEGEYKTALQQSGTDQINPSLSLGELGLNDSQQNIFILKGQPDILVTSQVESSNVAHIRLYVIKNGDLTELKSEDEGHLYSIHGAIKRKPSGEIQIFNYNNGEGIWYIQDLALNLSTERLSLNSYHNLSFELGKEAYGQFTSDPGYIYEGEQYHPHN